MYIFQIELYCSLKLHLIKIFIFVSALKLKGIIGHGVDGTVWGITAAGSTVSIWCVCVPRCRCVYHTYMVNPDDCHLSASPGAWFQSPPGLLNSEDHILCVYVLLSYTLDYL